MALQKRRDRIKELSVKRREALDRARLLGLFHRDIAQEVLVAVGDLGSDYEHGAELLRKLSDFRGHASSLGAGMLPLQSQDCGFDVDSVENLNRRHEETEREASVIWERSKELQQQASVQVRARCVMSERLASRQTDVLAALDSLDAQLTLRKERLQEVHQLQLFRANQRLLLGWSVRRSQELQEKLLPNSRAQALDLLQEHQDLKAELETREDRVASVRDFGLGLVRSGHGSAAEIQKAVEQLEDAQKTLYMSWEDRRTLLGQAKELQEFLVLLEQNDAWISTKEASLALHNLGSSVEEVEDLLRRHAQLEVQLEHLEHLDKVQTLGQQMIQQNHYDSSNISTRIKALATRTAGLVQQSRTHRANLEASLQLQHFLSGSLEVLYCVL
ncbi:hypothetical protein CRUP_037947 [Coryphaenoides rupestris]|nr:hypothetical protein CRUP_037947 [Coryphaenoides rupestris]